MAANYWASTQRQHWFFTSDTLADMRDELVKQNARVIEQYPYPDRRLMFIFMKDRLLQLGKRLAFRQQCVATAMAYLQRYFLFTPMQNVNIYLLVSAAFYLASKTEESPHHIRSVASEARQAWPEFMPTDISRLGEMEFCLISEMHSQLIVWHPYRSLMTLKETQDLSLTNDELVLAWSIVNDTYMTDLPLTCPPHLIAITAMFLAVVFVPNKAILNLSNTPTDAQSLRNSAQFSGLGGRPGISTSFGMPESLTPNPHAQTLNNSSGTAKVGQPQQNDAVSIKERTVAAAMSSEKFKRIMKFLVESEIDIEKMIIASQEIVSLYETWESYDERAIKETIARNLRSRGLDN